MVEKPILPVSRPVQLRIQSSGCVGPELVPPTRCDATPNPEMLQPTVGFDTLSLNPSKVPGYSVFQNRGENNTTIVNISKRPSSMSTLMTILLGSVNQA